MSDYFNSSHNEISPKLQGSVLRGISGSVTGMIVCILVMLLCSLFRMSSFSTMLQLFAGLVIGWFYRLFHGRRSKTAAYVTVRICTVSASVLWVALLALLSVFVFPAPFTEADWGRLWGEYGNCCFCVQVWGCSAFSLPEEICWLMQTGKEAPGISHTQEGMGIVSLRIGKVSRVEVDGEQMRVLSRFGRAAEFSVRDVSSVSRSLGWIVLYDREFRTLAKVDSYLEDLDRLKGYLAFYGIKMGFVVWKLKKVVNIYGDYS